MDTIITKRAYAKINLNLEIIKKRPDNYHEIESIFQRVSLYDELSISKIEENKLDLTCNIKELENESNILYKAYQKLKERFHLSTGIHVDLIKHIPTQAGLGGGSADCAAFLLGVKELFNLDISQAELEEIGATLGSDVVPCMYNLALLTGVGDHVTPLKSNLNFPVLIVKPHFSCSTKDMYERYDALFKNFPRNYSTDKILKVLENNGPVTALHNLLYNCFEEVLEDDYEIKLIKNAVFKLQGICPTLCGSGSCVFAIFPNEDDLDKAYDYFKKTYHYEVFKAHTMNK